MLLHQGPLHSDSIPDDAERRMTVAPRFLSIIDRYLREYVPLIQDPELRKRAEEGLASKRSYFE
jgi:hypothetical protein